MSERTLTIPSVDDITFKVAFSVTDPGPPFWSSTSPEPDIGIESISIDLTPDLVEYLREKVREHLEEEMREREMEMAEARMGGWR